MAFLAPPPGTPVIHTAFLFRIAQPHGPTLTPRGESYHQRLLGLDKSPLAHPRTISKGFRSQPRCPSTTPPSKSTQLLVTSTLPARPAFWDPPPAHARVSVVTSLPNPDSSVLDSSPTSAPGGSPGSPVPPPSSLLPSRTLSQCQEGLGLS